MASSSHVQDRPFYGKPYAWLVFGVVLALVPLVGYMTQAGLAWDEIHPAINAMLNGTAAVFLVAGGIAIKRGQREPATLRRAIELHRWCMISAFVASSVFLASYLARYAMSGTHRYPGDGADKVVYLVILFSHMVLAAALVPMALRVLYLAWKRRYPDHRRLARWTWPIWVYVSVTGVLVYLMLYPIAGALYR